MLWHVSLSQPRSNTAAAQVGFNVPQALTFERRNNKVPTTK